ncbi:MAG TPA: protein kinase [Thermoanaerobaculia bacterium]|nr:protein kinase [Thermoanaerobaculia bacterium]
MVGTILNHYEILQELGSGAMGTVYLARDYKLDRRVALKLLPPDLVADSLRRRRFDRESRLLAGLNHPNVVTVHSVEEAGGQPFMVMEWVQGRTLLEIIPLRGLTLDRMLELAIPMIDGVAAAHTAGVVHRDLKPANVMVRDDGVVKVLDFGISKGETETVADGRTLRADLTAEGRVMGTLPYMSPQQILGLPVDARSDVFSLGVILFEMLTGVRPFHGEGNATLAAAILQQPAPPLERLVPVPPEMEQVVQRCLEKEPPNRYLSARELRDALVEIQRRRLSSSVALPLVSGIPAMPAVPELPPPPTTVMGTAFATAVPTSAPPAVAQPAHWRRRFAVIAAAVALLALLGVAAWWRLSPATFGSRLPAGEAVPANVAIAVLPLRNLSGDATQDYFSDGTTEAFIANLARIGGLRVTSRDSVMRYRARTKPLAEVARELGVAWVVEGSVQRTGQQVMMVVQLIEPKSGTVRWGDTFQGGLTDIFFFQRQAAEAVARNTRGELSSTDRSRLARVQEVDGAVYESYLKARYLINKRTSESIQQALMELDHALTADPGYALAWAARAECYYSLGSFGYAIFPPSQTIPKAEEAARKAVQLDDTLAEAHTALAMVLMQDWRWAESDREYQRALELNPSSGDTYSKYTRYLIAVGRHKESIEMARRARVLDPLSPIVNFLEGTAYYWAGDYDHALETAKAALQIQDFWLYHLLAGESYARKGRFAEGIAELRRAQALDKKNLFVLGAIGKQLARSGNTAEARSILADLEQRSAHEYVAPTLLAKLHFALGENNPGFALLQKAYAERDQSLSFLKTDVDYETVRADPRYRELLHQIGL